MQNSIGVSTPYDIDAAHIDFSKSGKNSILSGGENIAFLNEMRGFAVLCVCLSLILVYTVDHKLSRAQRIFRLLMGGGHSAVDIFIVPSGYRLMLATVSGKRVDEKRFFFHKRQGLYPSISFAFQSRSPLELPC